MTEWFRTRWLFSFTVLLAVMLTVLVLWLIAKGEGEIWPKDFEVFYRAGERAAAGEDLYRPIEDGFYCYKYSPAAALLFAPLSLLPLGAAGVLFRVLLIFVFLAGLYLSMRISDPGFPPGSEGRTQAGSPEAGEVLPAGAQASAEGEQARLVNRTVLLASLVLSMHFYSELTLGQVNQIVIVAGLASAFLMARNRLPWLAGFLLALSVFIKPFLLIFLPYLVYRRRWRESVGFICFSAIFFMLPVVIYGWNGFIRQSRGWLDALEGQVSSSPGLLEAGNHTLFNVLARATPLRWLLDDAAAITSYRVVLLSGLALLVWWLLRKGKTIGNREALDFALLMLLVPLLVFVSENGFGFVELAVALLLLNAGNGGSLERVVLAAGLTLLWLGTLVSQVSGPVVDQVLEQIHDLSLIAVGTLVLFLLLGVNRYRKIL